MCGINLVAAEPGRPDLVQGMNAATRHRGPDDAGVHVRGPFALGNVRLAIRDVARGHQPMVDRAADVAVSFNGEVWNDAELRRELEACGHRFETDCDTEVVLRGYVQWGTDVLRRLDADFGLAVVDGRSGRALVARDRMGVKPLYYASSGRLAAASSEMKGVLAALPAGSDRHRPLASLDPEGLYALGDATEVEGVHTVLPGEYVEFRLEGGRVAARRGTYHRRDYAPRDDSVAEAAGRVAGLLEEAVRRQCVSDRPVAVALSGGIDSSVVAAVASRHIDVMAYSIGTADESEVRNARAVADYLRARGHRVVGFREVRIDEGAVRRSLDRAVWHLESSYPIQADMAVVTSVLAEAVSRDGYKVLLSGEGADELFLGYHSYFQRRRREGRLHEALIEQVENLHRYNNPRLDKSCMAHGVEARVPFQHAPLVEYAVGLRPELKIGDPSGERPDAQKYVLRRAVERMRAADGGPLLPADVVWRRKEYYATGMDLPGLIGRALGLGAERLSVREAAEARFERYKGRFAELLLGRAARAAA